MRGLPGNLLGDVLYRGLLEADGGGRRRPWAWPHWSMATVVLADSGVILTFRGAVPYETLTAICAALLLALVILPSADSSISSSRACSRPASW